MIQATVSTKGQITLPSDVRKALAIEPGDRLVFEIVGDALSARVLHTNDIGELFEALPGVPQVGTPEEERAAFHAALVERNTSLDKEDAA